MIMAVVTMAFSTTVMMPAMVTFAVFMMMAASSVFPTASVMTASAATAAGGLDFLGGGVAHSHNLAFESHIIVNQWVVEIHLYRPRAYLYHNTVDFEAVGCHHRQRGPGPDHFGVEFAVNLEYLFLELDHIVLVKASESLLRRGGHIEGIAHGETLKGLFERGHHTTCHTKDNSLGFFRSSLVHKRFIAAFIYLIEVVSELYIFAGFDFFHFIYFKVCMICLCFSV